MKHKKLLKFFCGMIILIFLFCYFIEFSGYYEYNLQNKKNLTPNQIKQFEEDVKTGKEIDLDDYLTGVTIDYSNSLTRTTTEANLKLNHYLKKILTGGFDILGKFIR